MNDPWYDLRRFTQARIAQGRAGCSLPTSALLDFQLAHAAARDAVHQPWAIECFVDGVSSLGLQHLILKTPIIDREHYLKNPLLGRQLDDDSRKKLQSETTKSFDIGLIVSNGLSSTAINNHGLGLLKAITDAYTSRFMTLSPVCLVANGRVALADEIGSLLKARMAVIIVGERPGLSASDSLGVYLTYNPHTSNTDAERNCLSNIRPPHGMTYQAAAAKLLYLTQQAMQFGFSGVSLKDDMSEQCLNDDIG